MFSCDVTFHNMVGYRFHDKFFIIINQLANNNEHDLAIMFTMDSFRSTYVNSVLQEILQF